ncbi:hypothetical protein [Clostridium saccharoperbutylacetonicum]|uniref:hypothetical protein n=1 Tax=Clostridium saccharoperbutylacetonicum TaxID=36745 RepID=UPI0039E86EA7
MDLATMGNLIGSVGFPIGLALIIIYGVYRGFKALCDKFFKPMLDEFLKSLSTITENNKILVETNASFVGNVNTEMEDIEQKVDRIIEKLG